MFLDFRSASIALGLCFFLFAGGLFVFQARRARKDGVNEWIAGQFLIGLYLVLFALRGVIPDFLSIVVANSCLTACYSVAYVAVRKFHHRPYRRELLIFPPAATFLVFLLSWAYPDTMFVRSVYITLVSAIQAGFIALILLRDASPRTRRSQWFTGCVFALITLLWLGRLFELLISPARPTRTLEIHPLWAVILLSGIGLVILMNIGALLMIRERSEEHLRESEERHRRLFEDSVMGISETAPGGRLMRVNLAYARMCGYATPDEMIAEVNGSGRQPSLNPADAEEVRRILAEKGFMEPREMRVTRHDGTPLFVVMTAREMRGPDGGLLSRQATHLDVTDRKRAEEERQHLEERLQRAEKMEALGVLAGGVAHDLNNVLGVMVGYSELMLDTIDKESPVREHAENILGAGERAGMIVQDLLTLARRGVHTTKVIDLNKTVREYLASPEYERLRIDHPDVRTTMELEADLLRIKGSQIHMGKTLMNVIMNAAESMAHGGEIVVRTENRYLDRPVRGYEDVRIGDYVVLSVSDTGGGISPEDLRRIFEPFYTKKVMGKSGTGLGLAVVWGAVKDHRGYIDVASEEGKGTTFTLYFPVTREEAAEETAVPPAEYLGRGESILVVDDVKEQRELAARMLGTLDYRVTMAASGEEAVDYLKAHAVDLIVLDMIMDHGMDGLDTYRKIIEIRPGQKAVIVSGFAETERVIEAQSLGVGAYVRKPYIKERLGLAVRKELDREKGERPRAGG
jgi:PAS domain S-box-containing protein